jgi:hypothetical protein
MLHLKTRTMLRRQGARIARINRGYDARNQRSVLHGAAAANRHCSIILSRARRAGCFHPTGGARVRGEP